MCSFSELCTPIQKYFINQNKVLLFVINTKTSNNKQHAKTCQMIWHWDLCYMSEEWITMIITQFATTRMALVYIEDPIGIIYIIHTFFLWKMSSVESVRTQRCIHMHMSWLEKAYIFLDLHWPAQCVCVYTHTCAHTIYSNIYTHTHY